MNSPTTAIRLGRNKGGHLGEGIDIQAVLSEQQELARSQGWQIETFLSTPHPTLIAFRRSPATTVKRIYLSTGIHGDEPAGPLAVSRLLRENNWPENLAIWLCPCLNPEGFPLNRRENASGQDLNRDYRHLQSAEIQAHTAWLQTQPSFDVTLCLHEDWEANGFYLYELNPDYLPSFAERIIAAVGKVCPIDLADEIEGRPAQKGIIRPDLNPLLRPLWPEAFFLVKNKTRRSYTFEAPSDFPLTVRVDALVTATRVVLDTI